MASRYRKIASMARLWVMISAKASHRGGVSVSRRSLRDRTSARNVRISSARLTDETSRFSSTGFTR